MTTPLPDPDAAFERAKREILDDIDRGIVPQRIDNFSELHDHVDANGYGGLFEIDIPGDDDIDDRDRVSDFCNNLQNRLDEWLRTRFEGKACVQIPGFVVADYENGHVTEIVFTPFASSAGYFGPSALLDDGKALDIESTTGPFWTAVQEYLAQKGAGDHTPVISWRE